jgi:hypothetical protein
MSLEDPTLGLGHRSNVMATVDDASGCGPMPGEVIVGANGSYLGNFDSIGVQPFGVEYPVGWTNGTWYEQPGRASIDDPACDCTDCFGTTTGKRIEQQLPDQEIDCNNASIFDLWDFSINPQEYTGTVHCQSIFFPANFCMGSPGGACGTNPAFGSVANYGWPLVPFAFANPSSRIRVVDDVTGPEGLEDCGTLEIDFSGNGNEGASFVGEDGGLDGASPPQTGINNADRSTTGWTVEDDSCWIERFWIKAVEDNDGFVCTGYDIVTHAGLYPFPFGRVLVDGASTLTLDGDWQEFYFKWTASYTNPLAPALQNSMFGIFTTEINSAVLDPSCPITRPLYARKGRVHVKQPHVYPCLLSEGVIIKRPSGLLS